MFFFGLLSTPMPYLLLAAFYFFGFAMGMFNNKTGDETTEQVAAITIPAEIKDIKADHSIHYFQVNTDQQSTFSSEKINKSDTIGFSPDTGPKDYLSLYFLKTYDSNFFSVLFSRPPPTVC